MMATVCGSTANGSAGILYWYGLNGEVLAESDLSGNFTAEYIFFNGQRVARRDSSGAVHYYFSDHLGTHSLITDANGTMPPQEESDFYPYGGEIPVSGSDPNHYKFTGKERDYESSLDYFGARHYTSAMGRFMQPDEPFVDQEDSNPQSWNLYSYVLNNPLKSVDPDGNSHSECKKGENGQDVCYTVGDNPVSYCTRVKDGSNGTIKPKNGIQYTRIVFRRMWAGLQTTHSTKLLDSGWTRS
jgi:RHS repeat-associated protein